MENVLSTRFIYVGPLPRDDVQKRSIIVPRRGPLQSIIVDATPVFQVSLSAVKNPIELSSL